MALIILVYAILALTFVIGKSAIAYSHPFILIAARMLVGALILISYDACSYRYLKGKGYLKYISHFLRSEYKSLLKIAFFHIYLAFSCEFWALQFITSSKTNLIFATTPFIAAALSFFILKESLSPSKAFAMILGFIGILPITFESNDSPLNFSTIELFQGYPIPEMILFIGVFSASYAWFDIKKLLSKGHSLLFINAFSMLMGGLGCLITARCFLGKEAFYLDDPLTFSYYVLAMVITSNIIFYNMYGKLMQRYSITFLTFSGFLCPLFGIIYGYFLLGEEITWLYFVSLSFIATALYIFNRQEKKNAPNSYHE